MKRVTTLVLVFSLVLCARSYGQTYHGGRVLTSGAKVYLMFYGDWAESDKWTIRSIANGAATGYLSGLTGYTDASGAHIQNASQVMAETALGAPYGSFVPGELMAKLITNTIQRLGWPCDPMAAYAILWGPNTGTNIGGAGSHNQTACGSDVALGDSLVYPTPTSIPVATIQAGLSTGTFSHELVEAIANPLGDGWYPDVADVCGTYSYYSLSTGTFYLANYRQISGGCTSGGSSSGGGSPPPPPKTCPPGTTPRRNSGKCK